jgi:hydroxymethylbilane synthase
MLPAPAQGAVGIEARADDAATLALLAAIDHAETRICVLAERAFLAALGADCHSPVGALAVIADGVMTIRAEILSEDGALRVDGAISGEAATDGTLADRLLAEAPPALARLFTGR